MKEERLNYGNVAEQKKGRQIRRKCRFVNDRKIGCDLCWYNSVGEIGSPCNAVRFVIHPAIPLLFLVSSFFCRCQWPFGPRRGSAAARLVGLRFRIPPGTRLFLSCDCCVLSGTGLCDCCVLSGRGLCDCCVLSGRGPCDCPTERGVPS